MNMSTFKVNKKMLYIALYNQLSSQYHEKLSKIQSKLLDTTEKQNLKKLKYDDNSIHRSNTFMHWIKQWKKVLACHYQFSLVIRADPLTESSISPRTGLSSIMIFYILINSYVEGHWKYIIIHPNIQYKGMEALKQIQLMCATLLPCTIPCISLGFKA
jgi:hypothetical protein